MGYRKSLKNERIRALVKAKLRNPPAVLAKSPNSDVRTRIYLAFGHEEMG
jgi:hypothetical protein